MIRRAATPLLWAAAAAISGSLLAALEPNLLEEGMLIHVAERLLEGETLYRDIVFFTGPLPFEALALLFRLFGDDVLLARGVIVALQALAAGLAFSLLRAAGARGLAHAGGAVFTAGSALLFPLLSIYFYTTLAFFLSIPAAFATSRGMRSTKAALVAGLLIAAVALCKQNVGALLAVAFFVALLAGSDRGTRWIRGAALVGGIAGAALLTLGLYALTGSLGDLVHALVVLPLTLGETFVLSPPSLWPLGEFDAHTRKNVFVYVPNLFWLVKGDQMRPGWDVVLLTQALYVLPLFTLLAAIVRRAAGPFTRETVVLLALLLAWLPSLWPRPDWGHLAFLLPIAALVLFSLSGRPASREEPIPFFRTTLGIVASLGLLFAGGLALGALRGAAGEPSLGPRVPLRPVTSVYRSEALPRVVRFLASETAPDEPVFVPRQEPLLYYAIDRHNPTPFEGVIPGLRESAEKAILAALPDVRFVVMSDLDQPGYTWYADELPAVQAAFERHYRVPERFPTDYDTWIHVAERGRDRGRAVIDLLRAPGQRYLLDLDGRPTLDDRHVPRAGARLLRRPLLVGLGEGGGGIEFDLTLPEGARFQADVGLRTVATEQGYIDHVRATTLHLVIAEASGVVQRVHSRPVRISGAGSWRWQSLDVDLSRFGGRRVALRLEAVPGLPAGARAFAWWGSPRIAAPAP